MATLTVIRRWALRKQLSIREIARRTGLSRNTIKKYLRAGAAEPKYAKRISPSKLDPFAEKLAGWLKAETMARASRGRYGITIDELRDWAGIELDFHADGYGWLATPPPAGRFLDLLAAQCRMPPAVIKGLSVPSPLSTYGLPYCYRCLVLNPQDVF